jgi:RNA polymerase sigma-70 factor, ECF subfamily
MPLASRAPAVEQIVEPIQDCSPSPASRGEGAVGAASWTFDAIYNAYAAFVWRTAFRLGVQSAAAEDVMQDVFLVVYRRLPEFEERTSVRAWLSAIIIRVVRAHRRTGRRKGGAVERQAAPVDPDTLVDLGARSPLSMVEQDETVRELYAVLQSMKEERREVIVLSELEELTAPEIAKALQVNINTVYWRLRTARREFERILFRRRADAASNKR